MRGAVVENSKVFAAIDIGTTKVFTVIGKKASNGRVEILGHGIAPCRGVHKGVIENVVATQDAVRNSVGMAERTSGAHVDTAFVGISGRSISYEKRYDTIDWVGEHGVITHNEVEKVSVSVAGNGSGGGHFGRQVIHAVPRSYSIDGKMGVSDPVGMHTSEVDVETHLVEGSEVDITRLKRSVEGAGIKIESLVLGALASVESTLLQEEKIHGAAMIDIGGGTTDVMIFRDGTMQYSSVIPVGGYQFTNDICVVYNTTHDSAEEVKLNHANVLPNSASIHEEVSMPISGGRTSLDVSLHDVCQLMRERAQELTRMIALKLREGGVHDLHEYPIILSGGAAKLGGFQELFQTLTSAKVRMGSPLGYFGVPRELQKSMYSTGLGILIWAAYQDDDEPKPHAIGDYNGHRSSRPAQEAQARKGGILSMFKR